MSIPIDKLYHYIESIAQDICGDDVIIYRFCPHGSKKLEDLLGLKAYDPVQQIIKMPIYCCDQEPLSFMLYNNANFSISKSISNILPPYFLEQ